MELIEIYESNILNNGQKYFDNLSHQFDNSNIEKNLLDLALYIKEGGNLHYLISRYRRGRSIIYLDSLKQTLIFDIVYLREKEFITGLNVILSKHLSETQLITILSNELNVRLFQNYNHSVDSNDAEYKIELGGYNIEDYLDELKSKEENLEHIILGNLYGQIDIKTEDKQTLIYENPWLDLAWEVEGNLYKPLTKNIHAQDERYIDEFNSCSKDEYKYQLGILPEPFWGNVLDAEIVILTLNPGYVIIKNLVEFDLLENDEKIEFIKEKCSLMSLEGKQFVPENPISNSISDYYWDKKSKFLRDTYLNSNKKIGLIQYVGYQSEEFKDLPKKITKKIYHLEDELLYTQRFTVRIVKYLIQQKRVIIVARNEKLWYNVIKELIDYPKLVVLDNYRNTVLTPNNCKKSGRYHLIDEALKN